MFCCGTPVCLLLLCLITELSSAAQYQNFVDDQQSEYWRLSGQAALRRALLQQQNTNRAKNVIIFLGDGMGIPTINAARIYKGQKMGRPGEETSLLFEKFPHVSLIKTYNVDRQVPDSAGTATAIFSGIKTKYETIGMGPQVQHGNCLASKGQEIESLLTWAQQAGKSTGIVTSTRVTHATPASMYAHSAHRNWESDLDMPLNESSCKDIAKQLIEDSPGSNLKVMLGGGRRKFQNRKDGRDLVADWQKAKAGTQSVYVDTLKKLRSVDTETTDYLFGLMSDDHVAYELDREETLSNEQPSLREMTQVALRILKKNQEGFLLLVEGGRIDHAHHMSNAKRALVDTLAFEDAIEAAMDMTDQRDTLTVVTADHSHVMTINGYPVRGSPILGVGDVSLPGNIPYTTLMYTTGPGFHNDSTEIRKNLTNQHTMSDNYTQLSAVKTGETHGGEDVSLYAQGPYAHLFHGVQEQHYIAHVISFASCVGSHRDQFCAALHTQHSSADGLEPITLLIANLLGVLILQFY